MDNLKNAAGETVDLYFVTEPSFVINNGETPFSITIGENVKPASEFGVNTIVSKIAESSYDDVPSINTMKHEGGHASYNAEHTNTYNEWLKSKGYNKRFNYNGHGSGDPSGERAKEFEKRHNK